MNKIKYILFFLVLATISTKAQQKKFNLILVTGINASQVNGDKLAGFDKVGMLAGAGISRQINNKIGWQFEILYSEKGSRDAAGNNNIQIDTIFRFNYIDVPIFLNYNIYNKIMIQFGVYNAYRTKAEYDDYVNKFDRSNQIRTLDHGISVGVNYSLTEHWKANFRVSQSVLDINSSFERYYNLYSSISIRYQL